MLTITFLQVDEEFYDAHKAIRNPTAPLFDYKTQTLEPRCIRVLERIFNLCDRDKDGTLNDAKFKLLQGFFFSVLQLEFLNSIPKVCSKFQNFF